MEIYDFLRIFIYIYIVASRKISLFPIATKSLASAALTFCVQYLYATNKSRTKKPGKQLL